MEKRIPSFDIKDILRLKDFKLSYDIEIKPYHLIICGVTFGALFTYSIF